MLAVIFQQFFEFVFSSVNWQQQQLCYFFFSFPLHYLTEKKKITAKIFADKDQPLLKFKSIKHNKIIISTENRTIKKARKKIKINHNEKKLDTLINNKKLPCFKNIFTRKTKNF